jgi:hypothetical protein
MKRGWEKGGRKTDAFDCGLRPVLCTRRNTRKTYKGGYMRDSETDEGGGGVGLTLDKVDIRWRAKSSGER